MSFSSEALRNDYVGNGTTVDFNFDFPLFTENDIIVLNDGVTQVKGTDYTVRSGAGLFTSLPASSLPATGFIRFVVAPLSNKNVSLIPSQPVKQTSDYTLEPFPASRIETDFDKTVMLVRALKEVMRRALKFATKSVKIDVDGAVDDPVAGKFLQAKNPGPGLGWATPTNAGALTSPVAIADGGTGATTASAARANLVDPIVDAKGDLIAASGADTLARFPIGADGQALFADAAQSLGLRWGSSGELLSVDAAGGTGSPADTNENNLKTYTLLAGKMAINGDVLRITIGLRCAANATTKRIRIYFGAGVIIDSTAIAQNDQGINVVGFIARTGASAQYSQVAAIETVKTIGTAWSTAMTGGVSGGFDPAQNLGANVIIKTTIQLGAGAALNDVIQDYMIVELLRKTP